MLFRSRLGFIDENGDTQFVPNPEGSADLKIWEMKFDARGTLWISTHREGILSYRNGTWSSFSLSSGVNNPNLWPILPADDRVCAGTDGNGVNILNTEEGNNPPPQIEINEPIIDAGNALIRWRAFSYWEELDRKSTRLNSSHIQKSRMPSSA